MNEVTAVALVWLLFGGTHLGLSLPPFRNWLVGRLGNVRFAVFYAVIAASTLTLLGAASFVFGAAGPATPALADVPLVRWTAGVLAFAGAGLMVTGLLGYSRSPMAELARRARHSPADLRRPLAPPSAIERLFRHPFFVGLAVMMAAHLPLARTWTMVVFFGGFVVLSLVGMRLQDAKLSDRHGDVYRDYLDATMTAAAEAPDSVREETLTATNLVLIRLLAGGIVVLAMHPLLSYGSGLVFAVVVAIGGSVAVARAISTGR